MRSTTIVTDNVNVNVSVKHQFIERIVTEPLSRR